MKNNKIRLAISLLMFAVPLLLFSQSERSVKGRVTTNNKFPLVNVSVLVKSTGETFYTDSLGYFDIKCRNKDKLVFTAIGFAKKSEKISPDVTELLVDMKLKAGEGNLDLALGNEGSIREEDRDVMFKMNNADEDFSIYPNIYDAIRGRVPGVRITGDDIILRGNTSLTSGGSGALMVVDGVIVSKLVFVSTPTSDIKSIRVLKGSEASIYGSRGGNGVIEVYTKRGFKK